MSCTLGTPVLEASRGSLLVSPDGGFLALLCLGLWELSHQGLPFPAVSLPGVLAPGAFLPNLIFLKLADMH